MKVMVVGSGGREHAIAHSVAKSKRVEKVYVTPGNVGMLDIAEIIPSSNFKDIYNIVLDKKIDLVIIGPEQPLQEGISNYLDEMGVTVIGPNREAARLESSKVFAKALMQKYGIPTAVYRTFSDYKQAAQYIKSHSSQRLGEDSEQPALSYPLVIKADGLAAGKGVLILHNEGDALSALRKMMIDKAFGQSGEQVIIEEYLQGYEASVFAFTDGTDYQMTVLSHDYKKIFDKDLGPNTGGMGAYAPVELSEELFKEIEEMIFNPLLKGLKKENIEYKGVIYAGLIFPEDGMKVLEFNCRLGDPETQAVLPLLETDFVDICESIASERLGDLQLSWKDLASVTVVAASEGYPGKSETGKVITMNNPIVNDNLQIFFSNVKHDQAGRLITSGGRVLAVTALAPTLSEASIKAYENLYKIKFDNIYFRKDIALNPEKIVDTKEQDKQST